MSEDNYEEKYTEPELRREIKEDLMESDKGGRPGQWSARKSQLLVQEYERGGGGYKKDEKDDDAKSLEEWTDQNWQTADGSAYADDGSSMKRYLPEDAWDLLSEDEKKKAQAKKSSGDQEGKQFMQNTIAAKAVRPHFESRPQAMTKDELYKEARTLDIDGRSQMNKDELADAVQQSRDED